MDTKQFDETTAELNAVTAKLTAQTSKIINGNPYVPLITSAVVTLAIVAVVLLIP